MNKCAIIMSSQRRALLYLLTGLAAVLGGFYYPGAQPLWALLAVAVLIAGSLLISRLASCRQTLRDETEAASSLRSNQEMLAEIQKIAQLGYWELDFTRETLVWSDEVYSIYEVDRDKFDTQFDPFFNIMSPADKQRIKDTYAAAARNMPADVVIHRFNFPDGRVKHVSESCRHFYDADGKLLRTIGIVQDVTARWVTEERLRQLSQAVEQSPVCVVITDMDINITYVNPRFEQLTGYASEEVIGKNPKVLGSGVTPRETFAVLWDALRDGREWSGEFCNRKKNGELYWEMAYISPVTGADGVITHYVAVKEDITERKRIEEQLRELSLSDELTGLVNRRGFMVLARQQIKVSDRSGRDLALVFIDMDGLKRINDTMGHGEGDRAICDASAVLKRSFRASDIIARIGGDEFVALSVEANEQTEAHIVERLQENINAFNLENGRPYKLAMSYGVTLYDPHAACTLEELLERGDRLMYQQKQAKKAAREA